MCVCVCVYVCVWVCVCVCVCMCVCGVCCVCVVCVWSVCGVRIFFNLEKIVHFWHLKNKFGAVLILQNLSGFEIEKIQTFQYFKTEKNRKMTGSGIATVKKRENRVVLQLRIVKICKNFNILSLKPGISRNPTQFFFLSICELFIWWSGKSIFCLVWKLLKNTILNVFAP